jgi:RND superfamily putative drug exporter
MAIDYGLFIVTRYREELDTGASVESAVSTTMATAGRTVLFSAMTVALSLASILVFPLYYLRSFAYAGIAVVAFAALSAVVVLPAVLILLGRRVDRWDVLSGLRIVRGQSHGVHSPVGKRRPLRSGGRLSRAGVGRWHQIAMFVMRHPVSLLIGGVFLLLFLGAPFRGVQYALPDESSLPKSSESHQVSQVLNTSFPPLATDTMYIVSPDHRLSPAQTRDYAAAVSEVTGVSQVQSSAGTFAGGHLVAPLVPQVADQFNGAAFTWRAITAPGAQPGTSPGTTSPGTSGSSGGGY